MPSCRVLIFSAAALASGVACNERSAASSSDTETNQPAASARASAAPKPPSCRAALAGAAFTIGDNPRAPETDDGEEPPPLPFATELGSAAAHAGGYAIGALKRFPDGQHAVVALIDADAKSGVTADLGRTYGDAEPPRVAASEAAILALVPDTDAAGGTLRVARIEPNGSASWGAEILQGRAAGHAIAVADKTGVVLYAALDPHTEKHVLYTQRVETNRLDAKHEPLKIWSSTVAAESPRLTARPGGYWAAWVRRGEEEPAGAERRPLVMGGGGELLIAPLSADGSAAGKPTVLPGRQVLAFDLLTASDGAALLAYREGDAVPGADLATLTLTRVAPDGAVEHHKIEDDSFGVGIPVLLGGRADPVSVAIPVAAPRDGARLIPLDARGAPASKVEVAPLLERTDPLLQRGGRLLSATARGQAVELSVLTCAPPQPGKK